MKARKISFPGAETFIDRVVFISQQKENKSHYFLNREVSDLFTEKLASLKNNDEKLKLKSGYGALSTCRWIVAPCGWDRTLKTVDEDGWMAFCNKIVATDTQIEMNIIFLVKPCW